MPHARFQFSHAGVLHHGHQVENAKQHPCVEVSGVLSFYNFFTATPNGADLTVVEESRGVMEGL